METLGSKLREQEGFKGLRGLITDALAANILSYTGNVTDMSPGSHGNAPRHPKLHFPKQVPLVKQL